MAVPRMNYFMVNEDCKRLVVITYTSSQDALLPIIKQIYIVFFLSAFYYTILFLNHEFLFIVGWLAHSLIDCRSWPSVIPEVQPNNYLLLMCYVQSNLVSASRICVSPMSYPLHHKKFKTLATPLCPFPSRSSGLEGGTAVIQIQSLA